MRAFAIGELQMSMDEYKKSTLTELILATAGYWRRWEYNTAWMTREIVHMIYCAAPKDKNAKIPDKLKFMPLNMDKQPEEEVEVDVLEAAKEYENKLKHGL